MCGVKIEDENIPNKCITKGILRNPRAPYFKVRLFTGRRITGGGGALFWTESTVQFSLSTTPTTPLVQRI
jgi:hypothetical protein